MSTVATKKLAAEEFVRLHSGDSVELIDGEVKPIIHDETREWTMPFPRHGYISNLFAYFLTHHVIANDLGRVATNDTFVLAKRDPDRVRGADVCFWSYQRLPRGPLPDGIVREAPELVAEVKSPTDRWSDILANVGEYLVAGVNVVIIFDPKMASAIVYRPDEYQQVFHKGDELVLPDILPGFALSVAKLFQGANC